MHRFVDRIAHREEDRHEHHRSGHPGIQQADGPTHRIRLLHVRHEAQSGQHRQGHGGARNDGEFGDDGPQRAVLRFPTLAGVQLVVVDHVRLHGRPQELPGGERHATDHEQEHHPRRSGAALNEARQRREGRLANEGEHEAQYPHLLFAETPRHAHEQRQRHRSGAVAQEQRHAHPFHPGLDAHCVAQVERHQHTDAARGDGGDEVAGEQDAERLVAQHAPHAGHQRVGLAGGESRILRNAPAHPHIGQHQQHGHAEGEPQEHRPFRFRLPHALTLHPDDDDGRAGRSERLPHQGNAVAPGKQAGALVIVRR